MTAKGWRLIVALALLVFTAPYVVAEEIWGSGCDPSLHKPFCLVDGATASLVCGAQIDVGPKAVWATDVRIGVYELETDAEIGVCVTSEYCEIEVPRDEWFILELEVPCGNGKLFWRYISRLNSDGFEKRPYSIAMLEELGVSNDRTLLAMAMFNMLMAADSPYQM